MEPDTLTFGQWALFAVAVSSVVMLGGFIIVGLATGIMSSVSGGTSHTPFWCLAGGVISWAVAHVSLVRLRKALDK